MAENITGKVVVVTGGTSGIGLAAASALAARGARIVLVGRDRVRGEMARKIVDNWRNNPTLGGTTVHYADLSVIAEMKRIAAEIAAAEPKIDVLVNNAGAPFQSRSVTDDGIERTFALNHLSYFVLSNMLLDNVRAAGAGRIVNVASSAHHRGRLDFDDLMSARAYDGRRAYGTSKLCNVLFTRELARRLQGTATTANALHPGIVNTRFGDDMGGLASVVVKVGKMLIGRTPEKGAETVVYLASSPEVATVSGEYFIDCKIASPNPAAQDDEVARRLWDESARLTGVGE